jgi:hypothetical protein
MSFKSGYMAQRSACAPGSEIRDGLAVLKNRGSGAAGSSRPLSRMFHSNFRPLAMRALQRLDSPASRDQINDRHNQGDDQQEMDQAAGHMESPA